LKFPAVFIFILSVFGSFTFPIKEIRLSSLRFQTQKIITRLFIMDDHAHCIYSLCEFLKSTGAEPVPLNHLYTAVEYYSLAQIAQY